MPINKFLIILTIIGTLLLIHPPVVSYAVEDGILAVVNDELITLKDLKDYLHSTYVGLKTQGVNDGRIQEIMLDLEINGLNQLIEDKLLLSKANKVGLEVREKAVDEQFKSVKAKYGSDAEFEAALFKNGTTIGELKNKIREQLKISYVIDHEIRSKIFISPQEVTDYYLKNAENFKQPEQLKVASILIMYGDNKVVAKQKADDALAAIKAGDDFDAVSKEYSDAPSVGVIERGQLLADIEKIIFAMQPQQVSEPMAVDLGIYIFKLIEKIPEKKASLNEVKTQISNVLLEQKFRMRLSEWVQKLKEEAYVEIKK